MWLVTLQVDFYDDVVFQFAKFSKNFLVYSEKPWREGGIVEHLYKVNYMYVLTQCLGEHIIFSFHSDF